MKSQLHSIPARRPLEDQMAACHAGTPARASSVIVAKGVQNCGRRSFCMLCVHCPKCEHNDKATCELCAACQSCTLYERS